jgi:hypothetical protein
MNYNTLLLNKNSALLEENILLKEKNTLLENEINKLKNIIENLNISKKKYYEKNKDTIMVKAKEGLQKLNNENPEKIKEYRRKAYLNRKEKLKNNITKL